jgi:hypothetical protein
VPPDTRERVSAGELVLLARQLYVEGPFVMRKMMHITEAHFCKFDTPCHARTNVRVGRFS